MPKTTFVDGNPALGIEGTLVTAEWLNAIGNHRHDGQDLDGHGVLDYAVSSGQPGAYEINLSPALEEYIPGMPVYVRVHQDSIGGDTLKIGSMDALPIKSVGQALAAGKIVAGQMCIFIYDGDTTNPSFQLVSATHVHVLGMGQTWQDVAADRAYDTIYTNTTGRTIAVYIRIGEAQTQRVALEVDGIIVAYDISRTTTGLLGAGVYGIVPPGSTYKVHNDKDGGNNILRWLELR